MSNTVQNAVYRTLNFQLFKVRSKHFFYNLIVFPIWKIKLLEKQWQQLIKN